LDFVFVLLSVAPGAAALAHRHPAYNHDKVTGQQRLRWMSHLPDIIFLTDLAMVGTHDTMSFYGGDAVQTQTMSLRTQLNAGVRALDIRLARVIASQAYHAFYGKTGCGNHQATSRRKQALEQSIQGVEASHT
jgi:hypothetical protein